MIRFLAVLLSVLGGIATAQDLPARFSVRDVAANDTLNIRAAPSANSAILGRYGPYAVNIEVLELSADGRWGLVGLPEGNGWSAMRYLQRQPVDPHAVPRPLTCFGTEPFWTLAMAVRGNDYAAPDGIGPRPLSLLDEAVAPGGYLSRFAEGPTLNRTLIVQRGYCDDGMSDRRYGFRAMLFTQAPDGNSVQSGCCTLDGSR